MELVAANVVVTWHGARRHPPEGGLRLGCALGGLSRLQLSDMVFYCRAELFQRDGASCILFKDGSSGCIGFQTLHAERCESAAHLRTTIRGPECGSKQLSHFLNSHPHFTRIGNLPSRNYGTRLLRSISKWTDLLAIA